MARRKKTIKEIVETIKKLRRSPGRFPIKPTKQIKDKTKYSRKVKYG